jgi:hypothetical protein
LNLIKLCHIMVGLFETTFQHASSTPLPPNISVETGLKVLHDFEGVIRLSPDCRGCKPISPPQPSTNATNDNGSDNSAEVIRYEVEDDLPFIPKRLWAGGVKYNADFVPTPDGCDITVYAPGGFTSVNHWRLLRDPILDHAKETHKIESQTKDTLHMRNDSGGGGWYVQIISDARCPKAFASFVKGFLKNSHVQLQQAFIEKVKETPVEPTEGEQAQRPPMRERRPTIGRRKSSIM